MAVWRHDGRLPVTNKPRRPASDVPERTACGHVELTASPDGSCALVWFADTSTRLSLHVSPQPVLRYRPRFNTDCVRVSVSACSAKLTRAEKGSVSTGRSAKTRLQHQKGENDVKLLKNPNTELIINHRSHHSFIQTRQLRAKNRGEEQRENLVVGGCFSKLEAEMATPQLTSFRTFCQCVQSYYSAYCSAREESILLLCVQQSQRHYSTITDKRSVTGG